ncbi:hypothetical protein Ahy_B08g092887 [Arachis hypogaea]|uniref:B box-type domain-containing protein n=1 Tax=Arachis hypogaea TaxID=3818 RepID=A0A444Y4P2_ARAHY|nr:hypothetical protein Ahy_B08g092887 [Arachis hypogaea]
MGCFMRMLAQVFDLSCKESRNRGRERRKGIWDRGRVPGKEPPPHHRRAAQDCVQLAAVRAPVCLHHRAVVAAKLPHIRCRLRWACVATVALAVKARRRRRRLCRNRRCRCQLPSPSWLIMDERGQSCLCRRRTLFRGASGRYRSCCWVSLGLRLIRSAVIGTKRVLAKNQPNTSRTIRAPLLLLAKIKHLISQNAESNIVMMLLPCDYCDSKTAVLFCRPDSAKLCISCDQHVHSANALSLKHVCS